MTTWRDGGPAGSARKLWAAIRMALPILVSVSDARFHNGKVPGATAYHAPYQGVASSMPNIDTLVSAISTARARFIGVGCFDNGEASRP